MSRHEWFRFIRALGFAYIRRRRVGDPGMTWAPDLAHVEAAQLFNDEARAVYPSGEYGRWAVALLEELFLEESEEIGR